MPPGPQTGRALPLQRGGTEWVCYGCFVIAEVHREWQRRNASELSERQFIDALSAAVRAFAATERL